MKLSVIIPAHGRENLLVLCLKSLGSAVQGDLDYEVCVVDDGSGLDPDAVRERVNPDYPFEWRSFVKQRGRSVARNEGIRIASGEMIVFLDSDMECRKGFLRSHLACHLAHPKTAVIGRIEWPKGGSFLRYIGSRGAAKLGPCETPPPWYFVTGNASVRRADLPGDSAFDETLPGWGGEDLDLGMRLRNAGVGFIYAPDAVSYHHFDGDLAGHVERTRRYGSVTLPVLIDRHPELEKILRLDLMHSALWRTAVHGIIFVPAYLTARILDPLPLPACLFDYLTYAAYASGWCGGRTP